MLSKSRIEFSYETEEKAELIAELLEIDNKVAPRKLKIETFSEGKKVITLVEHTKISTLAATLEDLIFTEKLISLVMEL
ncbi:hypothetical protein IPdc08_00925 [archaeon]|nr:hypothetical protein IPdc08_00925 [archaeon]